MNYSPFFEILNKKEFVFFISYANVFFKFWFFVFINYVGIYLFYTIILRF